MIAGDPDHGMIFSLTPGNVSDYKAGMALIQETTFDSSVEYLAMDKGYFFYETFEVCERKNLTVVVPPKSNFKHQWLYDKNIYRYRNEIERLFNRLKNYRRKLPDTIKLILCLDLLYKFDGSHYFGKFYVNTT